MAIGVNAKRRMSAFTVDFGYERDSSFCRKSAYNSQDFALMRGLETVLKGEDFQTSISNLPPKFAFRYRRQFAFASFPRISEQVWRAIVCASSLPLVVAARCLTCQGCLARPGWKLTERFQKSSGS